MGTIKQGILGGFSGKTGTVIGASWKGIDYMRGQAKSIANPRTQKQIIVRSNLKQISRLMSKANNLLQSSEWYSKPKQSAFSFAVQRNFNNAIVNDVIDLEKITFGEFDTTELTGLTSQFAVADEQLTLSLSWTNDADGIIARDDDEVVVVVVKKSANGDMDDIIIDTLNARREDEELQEFVALVNSFTTGDGFYAYANCKSKRKGPRKPGQTINIPARSVVKFIEKYEVL